MLRYNTSKTTSPHNCCTRKYTKPARCEKTIVHTYNTIYNIIYRKYKINEKPFCKRVWFGIFDRLVDPCAHFKKFKYRNCHAFLAMIKKYCVCASFFLNVDVSTLIRRVRYSSGHWSAFLTNESFGHVFRTPFKIFKLEFKLNSEISSCL